MQVLEQDQMQRIIAAEINEHNEVLLILFAIS